MATIRIGSTAKGPLAWGVPKSITTERVSLGPKPPKPPVEPPVLTIKAPGVTILSWDRIDADKTCQLVSFIDRFNPQFGTITVSLDEGYLRVEIENAAGRDKSSRRDRKVI